MLCKKTVSQNSNRMHDIKCDSYNIGYIFEETTERCFPYENSSKQTFIKITLKSQMTTRGRLKCALQVIT